MRTEFLFLERGSTPSEEEQYATYMAMAKALEGRALIVRALDIGGDKQVAHLELSARGEPVPRRARRAPAAAPPGSA
ncbi:PEP-utilizing enzyme, TIM barrel domain-containing protein [Ditylenchus destructor]|uniref:PEP-utilizing enzyme, TIM barrel domain-containing protein n=1 Tax=Ditylenchus destructor TaxID=166010 RepID=A0AAD4MFW0_9BILA|nr:PEP-utilizing enzyme, TIM barrel domain-containing protein [Ditylenchus destructor]